jgi:CBS domain-containing protein
VVRPIPHTVAEVMTTVLQTVPLDSRLDRAARIMDRHGVRQILVVDEKGRLAGLVSYRALLRVVASGRLDELERGVAVRDVMEVPPLRFTPATPLLDAIRMMMKERISAAPVLEDDRPVGIVSEHDVVALAHRLLDDGP